ncbi:MAG: hypothetical protein LUD00_03585, partial [Prevotellaceae bacterium]|nr:hypothetical protein [Prevotellaceae bacterium]
MSRSRSNFITINYYSLSFGYLESSEGCSRQTLPCVFSKVYSTDSSVWDLYVLADVLDRLLRRYRATSPNTKF